MNFPFRCEVPTFYVYHRSLSSHYPNQRLTYFEPYSPAAYFNSLANRTLSVKSIIHNALKRKHLYTKRALFQSKSFLRHISNGSSPKRNALCSGTVKHGVISLMHNESKIQKEVIVRTSNPKTMKQLCAATDRRYNLHCGQFPRRLYDRRSRTAPSPAHPEFWPLVPTRWATKS